MKSRAEVAKGLQWILDSHAAAVGPCGDVREFLEPALALLTPPTTAEIDEARYHTEKHVEDKEIAAVLDRALDALAREPGLEAEVEDLSKRMIAVGAWRDSLMREEHEKDGHLATLESQIARVRETVAEWRRQGVSLAAASEIEAGLLKE